MSRINWINWRYGINRIIRINKIAKMLIKKISLKLVLCTFFIAGIGPLFLLMVLSVSAVWPYPKILPEALSLRYLINVLLSNRQTFVALMNSIGIAALVTALTLVIAIPAACALGLNQFRGKEWIRILVLMPLIVPAITITTGIHSTMIRMGLTGKIQGVVLIHTLFALPYAIRLLTDVFEITGDACEEQARMLGAGPLYTFGTVTLPLIMPGLVSASVMCFIVSFSQYITTFLIGGGRIVTLPMVMVPIVMNGQMQVSAVYSLLFVCAALVSLMLIERVLKRYYRQDGALLLI